MTEHRRPDTAALGAGMQRTSYALLLIVTLLAILLSGCALRPTVGRGDPPDPDADAAIYAAVIRRLATEDDTYGGTLNPPTLYVLTTTDDNAGDPGAAQGNPAALPESLQDAITEQLADLPAEIIWVDHRDAVPLTLDTHMVAGGGALITLGNIHPQDDGTRHVAGSIWIGMLAAGGQTYVLDRIDGTWTITGTTGPAWIS